MSKALAGLIALIALCANAHAAPQTCTGKILRYLTYYEGSVVIYPDWRNDWLFICNLNTPWKGVSVASCAAWLSTVKAAVSLPTHPSTTTTYADAPGCSSVPTYNSAPAPDSITSP